MVLQMNRRRSDFPFLVQTFWTLPSELVGDWLEQRTMEEEETENTTRSPKGITHAGSRLMAITTTPRYDCF